MRNPEYQFIPTDSDPLLSYLIAAWERMTERTLMPADPDKLFISWVANIIIQERALTNRAGNSNIPSRASGVDLDALSELYKNDERPNAKPATCMERFHISEAQPTSILIPADTNVTDSSRSLLWTTTVDAYIPIGDTYSDVPIVCLKEGIDGNGFALGQINSLVDINNIAFYISCENITVSDGGSNSATDEEYYNIMRDSQDAYSTAGAKGAYIYYAKKVSTEIRDVVPNSLTPGVANLFVLMADGSIAGEEMKNKVLEACSPDDVRPFNDFVSVDDAEIVGYDIDFTYYIPTKTDVKSATYEMLVDEAVNEYVDWQCAKFGRDINPDELQKLVKLTGIKRIEPRSPEFTVLRDGKDNTIPQIATIGSINIVNGGYEDE